VRHSAARGRFTCCQEGATARRGQVPLATGFTSIMLPHLGGQSEDSAAVLRLVSRIHFSPSEAQSVHTSFEELIRGAMSEKPRKPDNSLGGWKGD